nr:MAG TPA: hypothetical protein [Caudoviricetes sp.]
MSVVLKVSRSMNKFRIISLVLIVYTNTTAKVRKCFG